jgi:hypothetical protein
VEQIQIQEPPELDQIDSRQENHKEEEQEEQGREQIDADSFEDLKEIRSRVNHYLESSNEIVR